jgi:predicted RNA-binding protein with PUA-like domain
MKHWLLVADPQSYGFDELQRDGRAVWDGIRGSMAQRHIRAMASGDQALIYHTAPEKSAIGTARVESDAYADPKDPEGKLMVADVVPGRRFARPVPLSAL